MFVTRMIRLCIRGSEKPTINLLGLPRELRDIIYGYVFHGSYILDLEGRWQMDPYSIAQAKNFLALLQTSKQLSHEAMECFYSSTVFTYCNWPRIDGPDQIAPFHNLPRLFDPRMMKIEVRVNMDWHRIARPDSNRKNIRRPGPVDFHAAIPLLTALAHTPHPRKHIHLKFHKCSWFTFLVLNKEAAATIDRPPSLFHQIQQLVAFRSVVIEITTVPDINGSYYRIPGYSDLKPVSPNVKFYEYRCGPAEPPCKYLVGAFKKVFEAHLGPAVVESVAVSEMGEGQTLHFRPQKYLATSATCSVGRDCSM